MRQHTIFVSLLALIVSSLSILPTAANPITIPSLPRSPSRPQPKLQLTHPNNVHLNLLTRATYHLPNGYTIRFRRTASLLPLQIVSRTLSLWYQSLLHTLSLPRLAPQTTPYNSPFGFHSENMRLNFYPQAPNLASRAMVYAFVEWLEERAARGLVEFFEAVIEGEWGVVSATFGLADADGIVMELLGGGSEDGGSGSDASGSDASGSGSGSDAGGSETVSGSGDEIVE